jgi:hypothetical protein
MERIRLEIVGDKVKVTSPYNQEFINKARNLRGKWNNNAWWFDDTVIDYLRDTLVEIFGTSGEESYETCTLLIKDFNMCQYKGPVELFNVTIAKAYGRDTGAKLGEGIVFIKGKYHSGGSMKNWTTNVCDSTFEIVDFPVPSLNLPEVQKAIEEGWCIVKRIEKRSKDDIEAEIRQLEQRIAILKNEL